MSKKKSQRRVDVDSLVEQRDQLSEGGATEEWNTFVDSATRQHVEILLPLGHLASPDIIGLLWAWSKLGLISGPGSMDQISGVVKQGIEPVLHINTTLSDAITLVGIIGVRQCAVLEV